MGEGSGRDEGGEVKQKPALKCAKPHVVVICDNRYSCFLGLCRILEASEATGLVIALAFFRLNLVLSSVILR